MRENDVFGVKPLNELLEIIKDQINDIYEKIMEKLKQNSNRFDRNVQKRKKSDFENIYKAYICKKRKSSDFSNVSSQ